MNSYRKRNSALLILAVLGLAGCSIAPETEYQSLAQKSVEQIPNWTAQQEEAREAVSLTSLMNIPKLEQLVNQAMKSNPSLQQTITALKIAYAEQGITDSDRLPQLTADLSGYDDNEDGDSISTGLTVSWELDLWNRLGDKSSAAAKDIASDIATLQSSKDSLAASIMRSWLQISYQKQLIEIESSHLKLLVDIEDLIKEKYRSGLGELEDLDSARTDSASTRATLAEYQETLAQYQRDLILLLGQFSDDVQFDVSSEFPEVMLPLASLPKISIANRPDVKSTLRTLEAEEFRTNAAYKALLPSVDLELALSDSGSSLSEALLTNPVWSILGQLSAPIFDGDKLENQAKQAELTQENAYWIYQDTLLIAVNEVDDALGQEKSLEMQQKHTQQALDSAKRSYSNYQKKYQQGLVDIYDLLSVQENTFDIQSALALIKYNRLVNRIDLGLALGLGVSS